MFRLLELRNLCLKQHYIKLEHSKKLLLNQIPPQIYINDDMMI